MCVQEDCGGLWESPCSLRMPDRPYEDLHLLDHSCKKSEIPGPAPTALGCCAILRDVFRCTPVTPSACECLVQFYCSAVFCVYRMLIIRLFRITVHSSVGLLYYIFVFDHFHSCVLLFPFFYLFCLLLCLLLFFF